MQQFDEEDEGRLTLEFVGAIAAIAVACIAIGAVIFSIRASDPDGSSAMAATDTAETTIGATSTTPAPTTEATAAAALATSSTVTSPSSTESTAPATAVPTTSTVATTTSGPITVPATSAAAETTLPATTLAPVAPATEAPAAPPLPAGAPTYPTLPDGSPAPLIAIFDFDKITLTGSAPSEQAKARLEELAILNSKFVVPVDNQLTIDPTVPIGIGVRIIELTSSRFEPGRWEVVGEHAAEFDRVATVLVSLPDVTALVIGHADQVGSPEENYKLSSERAAAVVDYLVAQGVSPDRLSSRAVGESDLLSLNNDAASLALNRRTEFVLYGLLDT